MGKFAQVKMALHHVEWPQIAKAPIHLSPWVFWHDSPPPLAQGGKKNGRVFGPQLILTRFFRSCSPKHYKKSLILDLKFPMVGRISSTPFPKNSISGFRAAACRVRFWHKQANCRRHAKFHKESLSLACVVTKSAPACDMVCLACRATP